MLIDTLSPLHAVVLSVVAWVVWKVAYRFFVRTSLDNIPGPKSKSILTGNLGQMFDRHGWDFHHELGQRYGPIVKLSGILGQQVLYVFDPKAMHNIVVKDQYTYQPAEWFTESLQVGFGPGLLSVYGETHRRQRKMLNPVFSINHMRHMTPVFYAIAHKLRDAIAVQVKETPRDLDMLRWIGRTALELIGQGGLGYSFDPLVEDKPNDFGDAMKNFLPTIFHFQLLRFKFHWFTKIGSASFRRRLVEMIPNPLVQKIKDIVDTMHSHAVEILNGKKQALKAGDEAVVEQISQGKDIISVLLKTNMEASEEDKLPEEEILAQMATLVFAATDTTTSALSQILSLLAEHPNVQERLRREILEVKQGQEDISYDMLVDRLPYLDAICRETLRLYPPVSFVFREAFEDAVLPLSRPIYGVDGQAISEISIPKGTFLAVGILASNRNKEIWGEDALEWKPERWLSPLPEAVTGSRIPGVYSNLMTFLGGGRACIGFKFSQLEMKVVLAILLQSFKFSPADCSKDITWNLAGVKYPTIGKVDNHPCLPLKVELISSKA
ncbi:cytochrome P450 [Abortiporus biennis]|nr:cytochrome P450 [Abortiporus biennis]